MDFRKATELFSDPDFDGDPVQIYEPKGGDPPIPPDDGGGTDNGDDGVIIDGPFPPINGGTGRVKYYVDDVPVSVVAERVQYYGKDGKLITESLKDYTRKNARKEFSSLDSFLVRWSKARKLSSRSWKKMEFCSVL